LPELELGEREDDDAGKKAEEVQGGEGGGGDSTQDDKGATQSTRELPELEPGAHDTSSKDGKKPGMQGSKGGYSRSRQVTCVRVGSMVRTKLVLFKQHIFYTVRKLNIVSKRKLRYRSGSVFVDK